VNGAGAQAGAQLFVADQEACFGRVYDRAHLAAHPNQTVTSLHIFRYLGERPEAENWQASRRDELRDCVVIIFKSLVMRIPIRMEFSEGTRATGEAG
jgi:hypothetical protein